MKNIENKEKKIDQLEKILKQFKNQYVSDIQYIKMLLMGCLGLQIIIITVLIFYKSIINFIIN